MTWKFKQYTLDSHHIDIVGYIPPKTNPDGQLVKSSEKKQTSWATLTQEEKDFYNRQRAGYRMKSKIRRSIIRHNMRYMWTLTFKKKYIENGNGKVKDAGELKDVWQMWTAFLKRCKRKGLEFKWIVTIELHEKRLARYNERVYHFHFCTASFIPQNKEIAKKHPAKGLPDEFKGDESVNMSDLWGHGFVFATNFTGESKAAAANYLTKYVTKAFEEIEEKGARRYRISRGLEVTGVILEQDSEIELDQYVYEIAKSKNCFFQKSYHCVDGGNSEILVYTIFPKTKRNKKQFKKGLPPTKGVPIKQKNNSKEEKVKCQSTIRYLQSSLF